ncbi:hypothetical protein M427DRAFT_73900 [Gonapodya prolifera JEL478]|uniref:tRNA/rRNA methyltransferase SpoU type domain-containing protein n=1 Tax=Gonapodya prolifera (strain JEL478) TaxID=1344416 RepID=A0A139A137_GONPJ|nr:hypothetical protein M427DRAFT_73900 [Gonapodya prolifera JEL478]|eukprot:KXS10497.1 hypothetical protein M427DRAFT_73900 [Gonapodya prolifera JEL478]
MEPRPSEEPSHQTPSAVTFIPVSDASSPILADYRDLKSPSLRENEFRGRTTLFIAEGETVTRTVLSEGSLYPVRSVILTEHHRDKMADVWEDLTKRLVSTTTNGSGNQQQVPIPIYVAPQPLLEQLTGFHFHRGVLASVDIPPPPPLTDILSTSDVAVVLQRVNGIDNVGSIFRNVACLAGKDRSCVLLTRDCCHPLYRKAVRVSVGHAARVRFGIIDGWDESAPSRDDHEHEQEDDPWEGPSEGQYAVGKTVRTKPTKRERKLMRQESRRATAINQETEGDVEANRASGDPPPDPLTLLEQHGFTTIAFTPNPHATDIRSIPRGSLAKPAIIVGAEGPGLDTSTIRRAQLKIRIPMAEGADSLNVATSVAIALSWLV